MSISDESWAEAGAFLKSLGYDGPSLEDPEFRKDSLRYLDLLLQKNQVVNLTGAKDLETLFWKHLVDSLSLLSLGPLGVLGDWGSGGGFPGIPLALVRKNLKDSTPVHFIDSVGKKARAIEEFCAALDLVNTRVHIGRGEDLLGKGSLRPIETIVMRAVAPAEKAVHWLSHAVPEWILFLGPTQREEWKALDFLLKRKRLAASDLRTFSLPRNLGERCLLRISRSST